MNCMNAASAQMVWVPDNAPDGSGSGSSYFQGYEGGEYVSSPVTGKVIEYGTHERINVYTDKTEVVGYVVIEAINSECFTEDNVANNSGDTEDIDNAAAAEGLNLFYDEYEDTCAGFTITIDGFKVDLNTKISSMLFSKLLNIVTEQNYFNNQSLKFALSIYPKSRRLFLAAGGFFPSA